MLRQLVGGGLGDAEVEAAVGAALAAAPPGGLRLDDVRAALEGRELAMAVQVPTD